MKMVTTLLAPSAFAYETSDVPDVPTWTRSIGRSKSLSARVAALGERYAFQAEGAEPQVEAAGAIAVDIAMTSRL